MQKLSDHYPSYQRIFLYLFISLVIIFSSACSSIISSTVSSTASKMASNLSYTILNSDDPKTVADGAPAYLLLMDSFLIDGSDNPQLLQSAASLYNAYAGIFVSQEIRAQRMSSKALSYAEQALCLSNKTFCQLRDMDFRHFSEKANLINKENINDWYIFGSVWAGWIKANSGSMLAIAQLPQVTLIMEKVLQIDEHWQNDEAHLYLGVLNTLLPPALGGKPEQGRFHFEKVIAYSQGKNLMAKVLFAEKYARLVFDQPLHDRLLKEVIEADPYVENMTLMNVLAQEKAQQLLDSSVEYF